VVGLELGLKMVPPQTIPTSADSVCLAFALYITDAAKVTTLCGTSGFNPTYSPYTDLPDDCKKRFIDGSAEFRSIRAYLQGTLRKFWSNYEQDKGHMKRLEEVVCRLP